MLRDLVRRNERLADTAPKAEIPKTSMTPKGKPPTKGLLNHVLTESDAQTRRVSVTV
jgi:hypothetical protein